MIETNKLFPSVCIAYCLFATPTYAESYVTDYSHIAIDVAESYADNADVFGTVELNGKFIQLPCRASLILDLGFVPEKDSKVPRKSHFDWLQLYDLQGREIVIGCYNPNDEKVNLSECTVYSLYYDPEDDVELGFLDYSIMGISGDTNATELKQILGEPRKFYDGDNYNSASYTTPKTERRVDFRWDDSGQLLDISSEVEYPKEVWDYIYAKDEYGEVTENESSPAVKAPWLLIIVSSVFVTILAVVRHMRRRRMKEILDTPIEELAESVLDKYGGE